MSTRNSSIFGSRAHLIAIISLWLAILLYGTLAISNSYLSTDVPVTSIVSTSLLVLAALPFAAVIHYTNKDGRTRAITRGLLCFVLLMVLSDITIYLVDGMIGKPAVEDLGQLLSLGACFAILLPVGLAGIRMHSDRHDQLLLHVAIVSVVAATLITYFALCWLSPGYGNQRPLAWSTAFLAVEALIFLVLVWRQFSDEPPAIKNLLQLIALFFAVELIGHAFNMHSLYSLQIVVNSNYMSHMSATCYSVADVFLTAALWLYSWKTVNPFTVKKMSDTLIETQRMRDDLIRESPDAIGFYNLAGSVVMANDRFSLLQIGRSGWPASGLNLFEWMLQYGVAASEVERLKNGGAVVLNDLSNPEKSCHYSAKIYPTRSAGGAVSGYVATIEDITERVTIEEKMRASIEEKNVLLKEIHHRVKNNLQIISSLLNLQSSFIEDSTVIGYFRESQNRVKSMAMIHERLYQSENLSMVNFTDYVRNLAEFLLRSYNIRPGRIRLNLDLEPFYMDVDKAISCGLILNELLTNSLKYAFPDGSAGEITVRTSVRDDRCTMVIGDDGVGFPAGIDFQNTMTLGMQLVVILTGQLDGEIELDTSAGTCFTLRFPL